MTPAAYSPNEPAGGVRLGEGREGTGVGCSSISAYKETDVTKPHGMGVYQLGRLEH